MEDTLADTNLTDNLVIKEEPYVKEEVVDDYNFVAPGIQEVFIKSEEIDAKTDDDNRIEGAPFLKIEGTGENDLQHCWSIDKEDVEALKKPFNLDKYTAEKHSLQEQMTERNVLEYETNCKDHIGMGSREGSFEGVDVCSLPKLNAKNVEMLGFNRADDEDDSNMLTYHCDKCAYRTKNKRYIKRHMLGHRDPSEVKMYQCGKCEYKTKYKSHINQHLIVHQSPMHQCKECNFKTKYRHSLRQHLLTHSKPNTSKPTMYECDKCEYKAKFISWIKKHLVVHQDPSERPVYQCEKCEYKAIHKTTLKRHFAVHLDPSEVTTD